MRIKLLTNLPISKGEGAFKGKEYETIECPESEPQLLNVNDGSVWFMGNVGPVRCFSYEFTIIKESKTEDLNSSFVSGKSITDNVRKFFLDNDPRAKTILIELGLSPKQIQDILLGETKLISTDTDTIEIVKEDSLTYKNLLNKTMSQYMLYEGHLYVPTHFISDYGKYDRDFRIDLSIENAKYGKRASFYAKLKTDVIVNCKYDGYDFNILFIRVNGYESLTHLAAKSWQEAVDNITVLKSYAYLKNKGHEAYCFKLGYDIKSEIESPYAIAERENDDEKKKNEIAEKEIDLQEQIIERATNTLGFFDLVVYGETYKVPAVPFIIWVGPGYSVLHDRIETLKRLWEEPVSERNIKCWGDNRYHNDWIIGAGLSVDNYYDIYNDNKSGLSDGIDNIVKEIIGNMNFDLQVLNRRKNSSDICYFKYNGWNKTKPGSCVLVDKGDDKEILNILEATKNGTGLVITSKSTMVAHIVSNAMELDFTMINVKNLDQTLMHCYESVFEVNLENNSWKLNRKTFEL